LSTVTEGGALEAAVIRSGASKPIAFAAGLVGTPATIEEAPAAARIAKGLALCNKGKTVECWVWATEEHVWQLKICEEIHA
jgi:hypothetical protein